MIDPEVEVTSYTYKPGVVLSVFKTGTDIVTPAPIQAPGMEWTLRIVGEVLDSQGGDEKVTTKADFPIPDAQLETPDTLAFFVRLCIVYWETHEVDEWFRKENKRVFTPSHHGSDALSTMQTDIYARLFSPQALPSA